MNKEFEGLPRRFDSSKVNAELDARCLAPETELADRLGISAPTLRRIRRGQPVDYRTALKVLEFLQHQPPIASADRVLAGVS